MPSPRENSALWDYVVIDKVTLPPDGVKGRVSVDAPIEWENDPKKVKGKNGARTTTQGRKESEVNIEIVIQDSLTLKGESQYDLTQAAIDELIAKGPGPFGIAHGATDAGRVKDIIIDRISSPKPSGGEIKWTIKAKRWDEPSSTIGAGGGPIDPKTAAEIEALRVYGAQLASAISANPNSSFTPIHRVELAAVQAKIKQLQASATKTPDKSTPTKQYYQDGHKAPTPGIPLGEMQP